MSREVPEGWRRSHLGDLIKLEYGKALAGADRMEGPIPVFGSSGIVGYHHKAAAAGPSIVISRKGSLGGVFYVEGGFWPIDTTYFVVQRENSDWQWLTYFLKFASLERLNEATGVPGLNRDKAAKEPVFVPPLHEQRRIAEILSSVDEAIAATRAVIEHTRKVKQGVLERLLTKGIGHTRFKQTEIGEIPEGWEVATLEQLADIDRGKFSVRPRNDPRYFGGDIPFVQTGDVVSADGLLVRHSQTLNHLGKTVSKEFPVGTILITIAANIGDTAITTYPVCCPDSVVGIVPHNGMDVDWLREYLVLQKSYLDRQATQNAQKNINLQHLRPLGVPVPPKDEQRTIGMRIQAMNISIGKINSELANLISFKSALMSDLLTGRKRVTDALLMAAE